MSITELAIKRPLLITVVFFTMILFGVISYFSLNYNLFPKFESNYITISTVYRGASSEEVQSSVTKPIEDAVSAIEGIDVMQSSSLEGVSIISIQLLFGTNSINAQRDAERKINGIKANLPKDIDDPVVSRYNMDDIPVIKASITSTLPEAKIYDFVNLTIKPLLTNVPGVSQVNIIGGNQREIQVELDNEKLHAYNIASSQVYQVITTSGVSYPAGSVKTAQSRFSLRLDAKYKNVEEMRNIIIKENANGSRVYLKDIATVTDAVADAAQINRINGKPAIGIQILKQTDANSVGVCNGVKEKLEKIKKQYVSENFDYKIASDQSIYTMASAHGVMEDLGLAILIVSLVMLFFLHSFRSATFILIAIPSAMIPTLILVYAFGFSLNLMSLMALSLVVGILVDDSIVVLENIYRHFEMGKQKRIAALEGRSEIGFTAIAITMVDIVVFLPLSMTSGFISIMLREYSLVIVFSTLMSLFVSFTLTPLLASRWGKIEVLNKHTIWGRLNQFFENFINFLKKSYTSILSWVLYHKLITVIGVFSLMVGTILLLIFGFVGTSFMGNSDRGEFSIQVDMAAETPLYVTNQTINKIEKIILKHSEVVSVFSNVGTQTGVMSTVASANSNLAEMSVTLVDVTKRKISTDDFCNMIRNEISDIPGIKLNIQPMGMTGQAQTPITIAVKGPNINDVIKAADIVKLITLKTPGTDYVTFSTKSAKSEIAIDVDRDKMSKVGLSISEVGTAVQLSFQGNNNFKYKESGEEYGINIILDKSDKQTIDNVKNLSIKNSRGAIIQLSEISNIHEVLGQSILERTDRLNSIRINSAVIGRPAGSVADDIKKTIAKTKLPEGVIVEFQGQTKMMGDAFSSLLYAIIIAVLLVYLIMVALYESAIYPFVVLFSIPVASIGAILGLALTLNQLTIFSILGMVMLIGLVTKNAILIVDFTNKLKEKGMEVREALIEAGKERLRPILMTTLSMVFGMMPIALARGSGAEVRSGMAWVIIGGLTSSLILTLVLVPSIYMIVENIKNYFSKGPKNEVLQKFEVRGVEKDDESWLVSQ